MNLNEKLCRRSNELWEATNKRQCPELSTGESRVVFCFCPGYSCVFGVPHSRVLSLLFWLLESVCQHASRWTANKGDVFSPPSSVPTTLETAKCVAPKRLVLVKWVYSRRERLCVNRVEIFSLTGGNFPLSLISRPFYAIRLTCEDMLFECLVCVRAKQKEREGERRGFKILPWITLVFQVFGTCTGCSYSLYI